MTTGQADINPNQQPPEALSVPSPNLQPIDDPSENPFILSSTSLPLLNTTTPQPTNIFYTSVLDLLKNLELLASGNSSPF